MRAMVHMIRFFFIGLILSVIPLAASSDDLQCIQEICGQNIGAKYIESFRPQNSFQEKLRDTFGLYLEAFRAAVLDHKFWGQSIFVAQMIPFFGNYYEELVRLDKNINAQIRALKLPLMQVPVFTPLPPQDFDVVDLFEVCGTAYAYAGAIPSLIDEEQKKAFLQRLSPLLIQGLKEFPEELRRKLVRYLEHIVQFRFDMVKDPKTVESELEQMLDHVSQKIQESSELVAEERLNSLKYLFLDVYKTCFLASQRASPFADFVVRERKLAQFFGLSDQFGVVQISHTSLFSERGDGFALHEVGHVLEMAVEQSLIPELTAADKTLYLEIKSKILANSPGRNEDQKVEDWADAFSAMSTRSNLACDLYALDEARNRLEDSFGEMRLPLTHSSALRRAIFIHGLQGKVMPNSCSSIQ